MFLTVGFVFLSIAMLSFAAALGGILYQHIVEFPNWRAELPDALHAYHNFFKMSDFSRFFKIVMPLSTFALLAALIMLWRISESVNTWMITALAGIFLTAGFTSRYIVPLHAKLFSENAADQSPAALALLSRQWQTRNYIRTGIMTFTLLALFKACLCLAAYTC